MLANSNLFSKFLASLKLLFFTNYKSELANFLSCVQYIQVIKCIYTE